jgi:hypothetical protein
MEINQTIKYVRLNRIPGLSATEKDKINDLETV